MGGSEPVLTFFGQAEVIFMILWKKNSKVKHGL